MSSDLTSLDNSNPALADSSPHFDPAEKSQGWLGSRAWMSGIAAWLRDRLPGGNGVGRVIRNASSSSDASLGDGNRSGGSSPKAPSPSDPPALNWLAARLPPSIRRWVMQWGSAVVDGLASVGDLALFFWQMLVWMFTRLPRRGTLMVNFYQVGVLSLPVVALTGTFIGMVLAVQSYYQFQAIGLESRLGVVINTSLVRELGPVLAATMLAGRVGGAMAAVLGTMRVTEQIDALTTMGADPIHYLVVPRFLACLLLIPALTVMADFMGIVGGYFYSVIILGIDRAAYLHHSREGVVGFDLFSGIFKSFFFGGIIAVVSCYRGFNCKPGAEGVGKAATAAFVYSFVLILAVDLFLNIVLDSIYFMIYPEGTLLF